jgi:hypothetical protein
VVILYATEAAWQIFVVALVIAAGVSKPVIDFVTAHPVYKVYEIVVLVLFTIHETMPEVEPTGI